MSFLAGWKEPKQNRVFKLINKLLLFQYSERIFSAKKRAVTLTLVHNTQLIMPFLSSYNMTRNSSFSQRYKGMNIETIEFGLWAFWQFERTSSKTEFSNSLTNFYCFHIQRGFFSAKKRALTLTLVHNTQLIMLFLSSYNMSRNSSLSQRYKHMNIETIENG